MRNLTPEEDDILRHHPASPAADKIRADRAQAEWGERAAAEQAKQGAAHARIKDLEAKIASNIAEAAARDMRIAELEREIEATHKVFDGVNVTWSTGLDAGRLPLVKRAAFAVEPGFLADAERKALEGRITELERDLAAKDDALKTANAGLARICEIVERSAPVCPQDAVDAVGNRMAIAEGTTARAEHAEAHRNQLNRRLEMIGYALDDAGAPKAYHLADDTEREIPTPERIRLLGERVHTLRAQLREVSDATNYLNALIEAHNALDTLNAPRLADDCVLSLAARVRSLKP